jgi:hypothetical protein
MDSGEAFFRAHKADRQTVFSFRNGVGNTDPPEENGDQGARVHPIPAVLGIGQKTQGDIAGEAGYESGPAEASGRLGGGPAINDR